MNEIFDWRTASRWWFRIRRFSSIALTGRTRWEVAVGTEREASMLRAIVAEPPTRGWSFSPGRSCGAGKRGAGTGDGTGAGAATRGAPTAGGANSGAACAISEGAETGVPPARALFSNCSNVLRQSSPTVPGFSRYCA